MSRWPKYVPRRWDVCEMKPNEQCIYPPLEVALTVAQTASRLKQLVAARLLNAHCQCRSSGDLCPHRGRHSAPQQPHCCSHRHLVPSKRKLHHSRNVSTRSNEDSEYLCCVRVMRKPVDGRIEGNGRGSKAKWVLVRIGQQTHEPWWFRYYGMVCHKWEQEFSNKSRVLEWRKNQSKNWVQTVLCPTLLLSDAIYIQRKKDRNVVDFKLEFHSFYWGTSVKPRAQESTLVEIWNRKTKGDKKRVQIKGKRMKIMQSLGGIGKLLLTKVLETFPYSLLALKRAVLEG